MSRSTYPRHKRTVVANSCFGIQKLRLLPVCEFFHDVLCRCLWRALCMQRVTFLFFEVFPYTQWNTVLKQFVHQLHHVPAAETSLLVQVQCSHVSTHLSAFLAGFTACLNTTSVLSQARATARLDHGSCSRGDCACSFSSDLVLRLPLLYRCSKFVIRGCHHRSCNGR